MNDQEPFTPGTGRKVPYRVRYVGMSDVDYRDEHRKALEHIERLEARLAAAERDRDEATEHLREVLMWNDQGVWDAANDWLTALTAPEGKAEDE